VKNLFKVLMVASTLSGVASVYAVPTLTVTASTGGSVTVTDGSALDKCPDAGCVTFIGSVGVWNVNVDTGLTFPAVTSPGQVDLSYLAVSTGKRASTITVTFSDSGFNGTFRWSDILGGTQTLGTSTMDKILVNGVVKFSSAAFTTAAYTNSAGGFITLSPSDVVTLEMIIGRPSTRSSTTFTSSGDKLFQAVPDGGSAVALLGIALAGLEGLRRVLRTRRA
jgi:hypothetical protein